MVHKRRRAGIIVSLVVVDRLVDDVVVLRGGRLLERRPLLQRLTRAHTLSQRHCIVAAAIDIAAVATLCTSAVHDLIVVVVIIVIIGLLQSCPQSRCRCR